MLALKPSQTPPEVELLALLSGHWRSQAIYVAAQLRLADALASRPQDAASLADAVGADRQALYRLLRALASIGIFAERHDGRFELTPMADLLRSTRSDSLRALALTMGGVTFAAWGQALDSVQTGQPVFAKLHGAPFFDYLANHSATADAFHDAMTAQSRLAHSAIVASYDFSACRTVVDVAGGCGALIEAIVEKYHQIDGVLFETPSVIARARARLAGHGLLPRLRFEEGDFFRSVARGGDVYVLAMVIHDWPDRQAAKILENCYHAMASGARLVLSELVIPPGNTPFWGKFLDLDMLVNFGGRERTAAEYESLLTAAGFAFCGCRPAHGVASAVSIVEARRP